MLLGLVLFKNILPVLSTDHKHSKSSQLQRRWHHVAHNGMTDTTFKVFTDNFVSEAFHLIVDKLLPLNTQDWQSWQDDPEEWFVTQMDVGLAWSYEFRVSFRGMTFSCVSTCFITAMCGKASDGLDVCGTG